MVPDRAGPDRCGTGCGSSGSNRAATACTNRAGPTMSSLTCSPDWYRWAFTGTPAAGTEVPIYLIWVE